MDQVRLGVEQMMIISEIIIRISVQWLDRQDGDRQISSRIGGRNITSTVSPSWFLPYIEVGRIYTQRKLNVWFRDALFFAALRVIKSRRLTLAQISCDRIRNLSYVLAPAR
jgi:hypothetical protein